MALALFGFSIATILDVAVFFGFLFAVVFIGISMSRKGQNSGESYFLAGRGLGWWLIGFSLIAANISTEQFVGMSGQAASHVGLTIASYEWIAAVTLIAVAFFFLPKFLRSGIYTIPEFLEYRYNKPARIIMSLSMMFVLVFVTSTTVIFSGAKAYAVFFHGVDWLNLTSLAWIIGVISASYVFLGGLKACAWADLLQGSSLIVCGALVLLFALGALGKADQTTLTTAMQINEIPQEKIDAAIPKLENASATERFTAINSHKLRMNLPWTDSTLPITALFFGIWIPNLYYWGLNQYIMQRTLGASSLGEGQKGIVFAAFLKLLIPFIVIFPGMIAYNLYSTDMKESRQEKLFGEEYLKAKRAGTEAVALQQIKQKGLEKAMTKADEFGTLFDFDAKFAEFEPDAAQQLIVYNAKKLGIDVPHEKSLMGVMKAIQTAKDKSEKKFKFGEQLTGYDFDAAFPLLMTKLVPAGGLRGFVLAALLGAIISSLASMLNAASTVFTMDIYKEYINPKASDRSVVSVGRLCVILFVIIACLIAPYLGDPRLGGVFTFIQEFQGFISSGILAAFLFGFAAPRASKWCGVVALLLNPIIYGILMYVASKLDMESGGYLPLLFKCFLNRMTICFIILIIVMTVMTIIAPQKEAFRQKVVSNIDLKTSKIALFLGIVVVLLTIAFYVWFWDTETKMFPMPEKPAVAVQLADIPGK
ncbi:MAG: sodium/solute symporter [Planctomycetaceae bacterium]|jgi:SSS family solute:Na+ symporter|nr:sodium/solute symporter [Planctomycetaceae bacterium]